MGKKVLVTLIVITLLVSMFPAEIFAAGGEESTETPQPTETVQPSVSPEPSSEPSSEPTPDVTPEATTEPTPEPKPEPMPITEPTIIPELTPQPTQNAIPEPTPETTSGPEDIGIMDYEQFAQGDGSETNPLGISTPEQLNAVRDYPSSHFILLNDIDLTSATTEGGKYWNDGAGWEPIGDVNTKFNGCFDGGGYEIRGLYVNRGDSRAALIDYTGAESVLKNLGVVNSIIIGKTAAGLVAYNTGLITDCYNKSNISAADAFNDGGGGIAGKNAGIIRKSYNEGTITTNTAYAGGITGINYFVIMDCYNAGPIESVNSNHAGGITGLLEHKDSKKAASIYNCYNVGNFSTNSVDGTGGIAQFISGGVIVNCAFIDNTEDLGYVTDKDHYLENNVKLTDTQMQQQSSFYGFDFEYTWEIPRSGDYLFPKLRFGVEKPSTGVSNEFNGGTGSITDPYQISTPEQLNAVRDYRFSAFVLLNDIDLSTATSANGEYYYNGKGWSPIGNTAYPFEGHFDGNGYKVTGMMINRAEPERIGLFGLTKNAEIINVGVKANITSYARRVGGIVGQAYDTNISGCNMGGSIENSYVEAHTGGIAGNTDGVVEKSYNQAQIVDTTNVFAYYGNTGGIVGFCDNGTIKECYNVGKVIAANPDSYAAGITGITYGGATVMDCYNAGSVSGSGIVYNNQGHMYRCYNVGLTKGIIRYTDAEIEGCFYLGPEINYQSTAIAKTAEELQQASTFTGYNFSEIWTMDGNTDYPYPELIGNLHNAASAFQSGDGSQDNPYCISTPEQLNAVRDYPGSNFILLNDIDMSAATSEGGEFWNNGAGWEPIAVLNGSFNGDGYKIIGLGINRVIDNAAFINELAKNAVVQNLAISNSNISGGCAAGLVIRNLGLITKCYNTSNISGYGTYAGGITAENYGTITECFNTGKVTLDSDFGYVGGIAGACYYIISDCYNTGLIKTSFDQGIGGVTGYLMHVIGNDVALVTNCYNVGEFEARNNNIGGIIGDSFGGDVINCYYLNNTEYGVGAHSTSHCVNVVSKSLVELKQEATYSDFDFFDTWEIVEGVRFPKIKNVPFVYANGIELDKDTLILTGSSGTLSGTLNVTFNPGDSTNRNVIWSSSNESVATIKDGVMTGVATGSAIATATSQDGGYIDTCDITVITRSEYFYGAGTKEDPYQIRSADDLAQLSELVNTDDTLYSNKYYIQTNDIDLSGYDEWTPIGNEDSYSCIFKGVYNGNGKTITGLNIIITPESESYAGLFGCVRGTVQNVVLTEGIINITSNYRVSAGGIVGYLENGEIINCTSDAKINLVSTSGNRTCSTGGIVGYVDYDSTISDCEFSGVINAIGDSVISGGIVGVMYTNVSIRNCINRGSVYTEGDDAEAGGIVGWADSASTYNSINRCYNAGDISILATGYSSRKISGGIVGYFSLTNLSDCFNMGNINAEKTTGYDCKAGGIIGARMTDGGKIINTYNIGLVNGDIMGAIAGEIRGTSDTPEHCYYYTLSCPSAVGSGIGTAERKTINELRQQSTYNGFNFISLWEIIEGERFPVLKGLPFTYTSGIVLSEETVKMNKGDSLTLTVIVSPSNSTNKRLDWYSNNANVVTVTDGVVKAVGPGTATISVITADGGLTDTCILNVIQPVTGVELNTDSFDLGIGNTAALISKVIPGDATNKDISWSSDNESVASVDQDGNVTGIAKGTATITVTTDDGGFTDTCKITVIKPVVSITINTHSETMTHHDTLSLMAAVLPVDASNPEVTWSSDDKNVATVSESGLVTAVGVGDATITATADGVSDTCDITVEIKPVTSVTLSSEEESIVIGDKMNLTAAVLPSNATHPEVTWSSSDNIIATVDQTGKVTAVGIGTVTITSAVDGKSDTCLINVTPKRVISIKIDSDLENIIIGDTKMLTATVLPINATYPDVTWSSDNTSVATIDQKGRVTAVAVGTAVITATADGKTDTCNITVSPRQYTINASSSSNTYGKVSGGGIYDMGATVKLTAMPSLGCRFVRWTENDATVSTDSSYNFTATGNRSLTAEFTALTPVGISCSKTDVTLYGGADGFVTISASGGNSGAYEYSINGGVSWQNSGTFNGLAAETYSAAVRDAVYTSNMATCSVIVEQPSYIGSVPANKMTSKANVGVAVTITPPAVPRGYTVISVVYSSSNPSVATVDVNGNVTFLAGGKTTIVTKVVSQMTDSRGRVRTKTTTVRKTVTVNQPVSSVMLNLSDPTIVRAQKIKLIASLSPSTASNKKVTWKSNNPKVAAVSSSGVVTGKAGGTAIITCTARDGSGVSASCIVTVTPVYPTGIKISKTALQLKPGKTSSLRATISPRNTDFKTVIWTSSNPAVVSVDSRGRIKALTEGTAVIIANTETGLTVSCTVTVSYVHPIGVKLSKYSLMVKIGRTAMLKAYVSPKNTDFRTIIWTSSDPSIATVDAKGRIKGISPGMVTITATTSNGLSASCTVTVR